MYFLFIGGIILHSIWVLCRPTCFCCIWTHATIGQYSSPAVVSSRLLYDARLQLKTVKTLAVQSKCCLIIFRDSDSNWN